MTGIHRSKTHSDGSESAAIAAATSAVYAIYFLK
jgi:hypothetical protein